jgi:hypothetical protein
MVHMIWVPQKPLSVDLLPHMRGPFAFLKVMDYCGCDEHYEMPVYNLTRTCVVASLAVSPTTTSPRPTLDPPHRQSIQSSICNTTAAPIAARWA